MISVSFRKGDISSYTSVSTLSAPAYISVLDSTSVAALTIPDLMIYY